MKVQEENKNLKDDVAVGPKEYTELLNNFDKIDALVTYSTLVEIDKQLTDKKRLEEIILIEIPNKIYPELRKVFIFIFESSGFREIKIDQVVDFKKLYLSRKN